MVSLRCNAWRWKKELDKLDCYRSVILRGRNLERKINQEKKRLLKEMKNWIRSMEDTILSYEGIRYHNRVLDVNLEIKESEIFQGT